MSETTAKAKRSTGVKVDMLARVEGEGALYVKFSGNKVQDVKLNIFEPPRLFEAFLRGRHFTETPDITARICGICPVAYQMSAVHAMEGALGLAIHPAVRELRRLFYCGEWIESHALHIYMLHAPDFLGYQDVIEMARDHGAAVEKALRLKKIGNHVMTVLGGREIHPISAAVGGFWAVPTRAQLQELKPDLEWALEASLETVKFAASLPCPAFEQDYEFVALSHPDEYALNEGRIVSNKGLNISVAEYEDCFREQHVKHSNALHSQLRERGSFLVGPLARYNLNFAQLPEAAREAAQSCGLPLPCLNPFQSIVVRAVELVFACQESLRIIEQYQPPDKPRVEAPPKAARGQAATEAPRGLLYHRYTIDGAGQVLSARIVPPTAQNFKRMEDDLWRFVPTILDKSQEEITWLCEQAVRNYDPCISCATHFLRVVFEREEE